MRIKLTTFDIFMTHDVNNETYHRVVDHEHKEEAENSPFRAEEYDGYMIIEVPDGWNGLVEIEDTGDWKVVLPRGREHRLAREGGQVSGSFKMADTGDGRLYVAKTDWPLIGDKEVEVL